MSKKFGEEDLKKKEVRMIQRTCIICSSELFIFSDLAEAACTRDSG